MQLEDTCRTSHCTCRTSQCTCRSPAVARAFADSELETAAAATHATHPRPACLNARVAVARCERGWFSRDSRCDDARRLRVTVISSVDSDRSDRSRSTYP
eukprot:3587730-Rhodomonas_salina.1